MKAMLALLLAAGPATARDVNGVFQNVYWPDSGVKTTVATPQPGTSIWALVQSDDGWTRYPGTVNPDGSFIVHGVPDGKYFLAIDNGSGTGPTLTELTTSTPDASTVVASRQNLAFAHQRTPVALTLTGFDPWTQGSLLSGDLFQINGSQDNLNFRPFRNRGPTVPAPGSTSFAGTIDWNFFQGLLPHGLPDSSQGDVTYFHTNPHSIIGTGAAAATMRQATHFAREAITIKGDGTDSLTVHLQPAPQTGSLRADVRYSQFEQLAAKINPAAALDFLGFDVFGSQHTVSFPDQPSNWSTVVLIFFGLQFNGLYPPDTDYGTLRYGEFLDSLWVKSRYLQVFYTVPFTAPGANASADWLGTYQQVGVPETDAVVRRAIAPRFAPVVPFIEGKDGFATQAKVSLTPTISWTQPGELSGDDDCREKQDGGGRANGTDEQQGDSGRCAGAGSTTVTVVELGGDPRDGGTAFNPVLVATVYGNSFTVPPGFLTPGSRYFVDLGSSHGSWQRIDQPLFRFGPAELVDTVTAAFTTTR